jgi:chromosome segregation ATPase
MVDIVQIGEVALGVGVVVGIGCAVSSTFRSYVFFWAKRADEATSSDSQRMQREIDWLTRAFNTAKAKFDDLKGDFAHENNVLFSLQHKLEDAETAYKRAAEAPGQYTKEAVDSRFADVGAAQHAYDTQKATVDGMKGPLEAEQRTMAAAKRQLETLASQVTDVQQKEQLTAFNRDATTVLAGTAAALNPGSGFNQAKDDADRQLERSKEHLKDAMGGEGKIAADEADAAAADAEARRKLNEKLGIPTATPAPTDSATKA